MIVNEEIAMSCLCSFSQIVPEKERHFIIF